MLNLSNRIRDAAIVSIISACLTLVACHRDVAVSPSYEVKATPLVITMQGEGEIEAAKAQLISSPGRRPMTIEWLAPENTRVKKGDVIVRFDAEQILYESRDEEFEMLMIDQDIVKTQAEQARTLNDIHSEQGFVDQEYNFTNRFAIDDVSVYSKLEIIETLQNKDFLQAKDSFLDWRESSVNQQNESANAVLDVRKSGHEQKFNLYQESLSQLDVFAPFDGLLTYERDKNGEKPSVGQTVFPGKVIAKLPNLTELQAKVYVLAKDAINLHADLPVEISLEASPKAKLSGKVKSVSSFPSSISRGSPISYFEVIVRFDEQNIEGLNPGNKVHALIKNTSNEDSLTVPIQALEHDQTSSFVFMKKGGEWQKTNVTTGAKNHYFVEIKEGLKAGDIIALAPQDKL